MATQTILISATEGETLTLEVYSKDSDTAEGTASLTEQTNRHGYYAGSFTDLAAGDHICVVVDASNNVISHQLVTTTATTDTFLAQESLTSSGGGSGDITQISGSATAADRLEAILLAAGSSSTAIASKVIAVDVAVQNIDDSITSGTITRRRGDDWTIDLDGLGAITGNEKVWFAVKTGTGKADSASMLQIEKAGLLYIDGQSATATNGTLTIDDASAGDITITLKAVETAKLDAIETAVYDVQWKDASGNIKTLTDGKFVISEDVNRATS